MELNIRDKIRRLIDILMHYGIIIISVFILSRFGVSPKGWLMNAMLLMGYMWIDIYLLNKKLIDKKGMIFAKFINGLVFLLLNNRYYGFDVFLTLGISVVIILLYWSITKNDNSVNWTVIIILLSLGIFTHGYIGLSIDRNNSLRDSLDHYVTELHKISSKMENDYSYYEEAINNIAFLEWFYFYKMQDNVLNGRGAALRDNSIITPMSILELYNDRKPNREILKVVCNRFVSNLGKLLQDKNLTRREVRKFFKEQEKKAYLYPDAKGEKLNRIFYEWIREYDNSRGADFMQNHYDRTRSLELIILVLGELDFEEFEEIEKSSGKIELNQIVSNFEEYDWMTIESVFNAYKNSTGEHKQEIFNGLQSLYFNGDYRQIMIDIAQRDEDFKELVDKLEVIYRD